MTTTLSYAKKLFKRGDSIHIRAHQVWLILVAYAMFGKTLTYGELATKMGYDTGAARTTIKPLAIIAKYCLDNDIPQLNAIVVTQATGLPGDEVILKGNETSSVAQQRVFRHDWFSLRVPSPGTFRKVWEEWR